MRRGLTLAFAFAACAPWNPCLAGAETPPADKAAAESLFVEGRRLFADGRYPEACEKFVESQKLDAGVGTLLNLARCYQANGQIATAWATFREAAAAARAGGQTDRENRARAEANALEPQVPKLTIQVDGASDRTELLRDGIAVAHGIWGVAVPVDPGQHQIEARSPGKKRWSGTVQIVKGGSATVRVPPLDVDPTYQEASPAPSGRVERGELTVERSHTQRDVGMILGGFGIVGVLAGGYFGLRAIGQWSDAKNACPGDLLHCPDANGPALHDSADRSATVSTIAFVAGGAALAGGAVLYFTAPKAQRFTALSLSTARAGVSIGIEGHF